MRAHTLFAFLPFVAACALGPDDWSAWEQGLGADDSAPVDSQNPDDTGLEDADTGPGDTVGTDTGLEDTGSYDIEVLSFSPSFGPRGGGTTVEILGSGFADTVAVRFGDDHAELASSSASSLEVRTPAVDSEGWVEVVVTRGASEGAAPESFRFLDTEDHTGSAGALGAMQWFDYVGGYWAPGTRDYGTLQLWFPGAAGEAPYRELFAATADSCASDRFEVDSGGGLDLTGASVRLVGDMGELTPSWNAGQVRFDLDIGDGMLESDTVYDLEVSGLWDLPDFTIEEVARTPEPFLLTSPTMSGALPASLRIDELDFSWESIDAEWVVFYIVRMSNDGQSQLEVLSCLAENDGAFTVPSSAWSDWEAGNELWTFVGALREVGATVPLNNGDSSVVGISWNVGGIVAR